MGIKVEKDSLIKEFLLYYNMKGIPTRKDFVRKNGLSSFSTYKSKFEINNILELIDVLEIEIDDVTRKELLYKGGQNKKYSKEFVIGKIYEMKNLLNRPIMYDDFRNPNEDEIGITFIKKYWGSMNKMKEELGLEIIQEDMMHKKRTHKEAMVDILNCCNEILKSENRRIITTKDIKRYCPVNAWSYTKLFKENNNTLRDYIISIGFELQKEGNGLNYIFKDGEKVRSQHELEFSKLLRNKLGLKYDNSYYRDIRYREFIEDYDGLLDCDYVINYDNRKFYIEIAGMLRDYKENYLNDIPIVSSRSKEKYRKKLMQKEQMLKENNLEYHILFPSDLQEDFIMQIFNKEAI